MTAYITDDLIDAAERAGACGDALVWLRERRRTVNELARYRSAWYLWAAGKLPAAVAAPLTDVVTLDDCAARAPLSALRYAAALLTSARRAACRRKRQVRA